MTEIIYQTVVEERYRCGRCGEDFPSTVSGHACPVLGGAPIKWQTVIDPLYPPLEETRGARMLGILLVLGMVAVALAITGGAIWFWTR